MTKPCIATGFAAAAAVVVGLVAVVGCGRDPEEEALGHMIVAVRLDAQCAGANTEGVRAWAQYLIIADDLLASERALVVSGDATFQFRKLSPKEYFTLHPEYCRTPEQEASLNPDLRLLIAVNQKGVD